MSKPIFDKCGNEAEGLCLGVGHCTNNHRWCDYSYLLVNPCEECHHEEKNCCKVSCHEYRVYQSNRAVLEKFIEWLIANSLVAPTQDGTEYRYIKESEIQSILTKIKEAKDGR